MKRRPNSQKKKEPNTVRGKKTKKKNCIVKLPHETKKREKNKKTTRGNRQEGRDRGGVWAAARDTGEPSNWDNAPCKKVPQTCEDATASKRDGLEKNKKRGGRTAQTRPRLFTANVKRKNGHRTRFRQGPPALTKQTQGVALLRGGGGGKRQDITGSGNNPRQGGQLKRVIAARKFTQGKGATTPHNRST